MFELIVACDLNYGIGYNGNLPWRCSEELKQFKRITDGATLIVGRKTAETLPKLAGRRVLCLTTNVREPLKQDQNNCLLINNVKDIQSIQSNGRIVIAGGGQTYSNLISLVDTIHISTMKYVHTCDTFFSRTLLDGFVIEEEHDHTDFTYCKLIRGTEEQGYLQLLKKTISSKPRRGRNGLTFSTFGENLSFDLRKGFPLLTTKKMFFRGIVEELLFFIRGQTDSKILEEKGINIWKYNSDRKFLDSMGMVDRKEGILGPMYGYNWRYFGAPYDENEAGPLLDSGFDQLRYIVDTIKKDPTSRRIIMTNYNPQQASQGVLYPCHSLVIQFYVDDNHLDMFCYNRSQDLFLGTPFNIASSALLLSFVAKITKLCPRYLKMSLGDVHIYEQHLDAVKTQMERVPYTLPLLVLPEMKDIEDIEKLNFDQVVLVNYKSHPAIKADMVA